MLLCVNVLRNETIFILLHNAENSVITHKYNLYGGSTSVELCFNESFGYMVLWPTDLLICTILCIVLFEWCCMLRVRRISISLFKKNVMATLGSNEFLLSLLSSYIFISFFFILFKEKILFRILYFKCECVNDFI